MKICCLANARLPTRKAHGLAVMKMAEAFARTGAEVELIVPHRSNPIKHDPFEYYGVETNFKIKKLPCLDVVQWGRAGFLLQWSMFALMAFLYSLFHKSDWYYGRDDLSLWFVSLFNKNIVWESHTVKKSRYIKGLLSRSRALVVISKGLKDYYVSVGVSPDKILIEPSGVDVEMFELQESKEEIRQKLGLPQGRRIVAYIGKYKTVGQSKGVEELLESFKELANTRRDIFLLLVGANKSQAKEVLDDNVKVVPAVPPLEVPLYMKASDILVMNYPRTEHFANFMSPLKLFEYMASGTPIITSDLPTIREVLDETTAGFFEPNVPQSLIKSIAEALDNYPEMEKRAAKALVRVREFSWKNRANRIEEFLGLDV